MSKPKTGDERIIKTELVDFQSKIDLTASESDQKLQGCPSLFWLYLHSDFLRSKLVQVPGSATL